MCSRIRTQNNEKCRLFLAPRNGQVLLGMSDIDVLNIIKIIIYTISAEQTVGSSNCCTKMNAAQRDNPKQETVRGEIC